ncbi:unnamed protein product [Thelazia callipaeda]|uniref:Thymidine kinase n=1 Tax=Thelazia callipaeda TaxID=103827 RepID=A0A0N5D0T7_THECL|nr:unnamed protein product [Thelazia callipaeda]
MFSGKTTELIRRRNRYALANRTCMVVKYSGDTRYDLQKVVTHDLITKNDITAYNKYFSWQMQDATIARTVGEIFEILKKYEIILIDEGQFVCYQFFICSLAEEIVKLKAVCIGCGNDASFTHRIISNQKAIFKSLIKSIWLHQNLSFFEINAFSFLRKMCLIVLIYSRK